MTRGGWCCTRDGSTSMSRTDQQLGPLVDLARERPQVPAKARNMSPIVPRGSIAGSALVAVVAIMTFLASMTTATSALPAIEPRGTIGDILRALAGTCGRSRARSTKGPSC